GGVPTMGKQKAAMAGKPDPKNTRHALGDIGNIEANNQRAPWATSATSNRKPQLHEPANRPVTRNFGAQLLKNAQEKAKNPPVPPPPEHVIEISSDTDVTKSEADSVNSVRKDPGVQDIDKLDGGSQLAVVDYIEDIYKFYKFAEILEVHQKFDLMSESLYLTVYIIDMYLLLQPVLRRELQLVGVSALLILENTISLLMNLKIFIRYFDSVFTKLEKELKMLCAFYNYPQQNLCKSLSDVPERFFVIGIKHGIRFMMCRPSQPYMCDHDTPLWDGALTKLLLASHLLWASHRPPKTNLR
ncbi:hypothetical protein ZWY2020_059963, partial [Hordeum vulgare]